MDHEPIEEYKLKLKNLKLEPKPEYKRIKCPSCHSVVPADNLNINDKIGKCGSCNVVFPFEKSISSLINFSKPKQKIAKPEGINIYENRDELELSLQPPTTIFDVLPLMIIFLATFFFSIAFFTKGIGWIWPATSWILLMFPIYNLFQLKNHRVFLHFDDQFLYIKWRPNKWIKDKKIRKDEIEQIYIKNESSHKAIYMISNGPDGQKHTRIITGLIDLSKARFLEQEMERYLEIEDREVPGEWK
ncbi:MAG: hypothetical protein AB8F94_08945 [Saprospiraceae bacterium]